jgi:hypothetical protein
MGPADQSKIFDVSKPHKVVPSASSRPLIVGHHPLMPDPMVLEQREQYPKIHAQEPIAPGPSPPVLDEEMRPPAPVAPLTFAPSPIPEPASLEPPEKAYTTYNKRPQPIGPLTTDNNAPQPTSEPTIVPSIQNHFQDPINPPEQPKVQMPSFPVATSPVTPQDQFIPSLPLTVPASEPGTEKPHHVVLLAITIAIVIALAIAAGIYFLKIKNNANSNPVQSTAILWNIR